MEITRKRSSNLQESNNEDESKEYLFKPVKPVGPKKPVSKRFLTVNVIALLLITTALLGIIWAASSWNFLAYFHKCELPLKYSIIFDAGSTGSRIHVFSFYNDSGNFLLDNEIFEEVKPGLSSFADHPKEAANSLLPLMEIAEKGVPKEMQSETSLVLYATAGLRLLKGNQAENILTEVKILLKKYSFRISDDSVSIMSGKNEAIFGWIAMNYLLGRLQDMRNTVALMDLGGGSTQVTFLASDQETMSSNPHDLKTLNLFGHNVTIYAKSYLGRGLMEARFKVLGGKEDDFKPVTEEKTELLLKSPCVADNQFTKWHYRGVTYKVQGHGNALGRNFESCFMLMLPLTNVIFKPKELQTMELYAISYFNDRADDSGLLDLEIGGHIQVVKFYNKAKHYCDKSVDKHPFLCLDLSYITALLWKGYGIDGLREINLFKKINNVETSWCLGASLIALMNGQS